MFGRVRRVVICYTLCTASLGCDGGSPAQGDGGTLSDASYCADVALRAAPIWISTSDYSSGQIVALDPTSRCVWRGLATVTGDTLLARHQDSLLALQYTLGSIDELARFRTSGLALTLTTSVSPRLDNQSANVRSYVALDADTALFTRNDQSSLGVYSVRENTVVSNIDLAALRGDSQKSRPFAIALTDTQAFVSLQRIPVNFDQWSTAGIAVLDRRSLALVDANPAITGVQAIELGRGNPFGTMALRGPWLFVPCAGSLRAPSDGAIARIDTRTLTVSGYVAEEASLAGNPLHVLALDDERLLVVTMTEPAANDQMTVAHTRLVEFNLTNNRVVRTWMDVPEYALTAPAMARDGRVYIGDRGSEGLRRPSGIVIFANDGTRLNELPIPLGLPPYHLLAD